MRNVGLAVAWIAGIAYASIPSFWLAIHPFADRWRSRRGQVYPIIGLVWFALIVALGATTWTRRAETLYSSPWSLVVAAALFGLGIFTYRRIGHDFGGDRLIGRSEVQPEKYEQRLITTGMHSRMRHPIYIAHLCMLTAWTVGSGLIVLYALWAFAIVTGVFMIRTEDAELEERFGDEFREYKKRVRAILPFSKALAEAKRDAAPSATSVKLRAMLGLCGVCKKAVSLPHGYVQFASMIADDEHRRNMAEFFKAARTRDWALLHTYQEWKSVTNDLIAYAIRCPEGGGMMVGILSPFELYASDEVYFTELLNHEEMSSVSELISDTPWQEL